MFKKIEIWILYLILVFAFISCIIFGALVKRQLKTESKKIPIITPLSKAALFLSEIPENVMKMIKPDTRFPHRSKKNRKLDYSGFKGLFNDKEKYLLLSRYNGDIRKSVIELIDLTNFKSLHTWDPDINEYIKRLEDPENEKWKKFMDYAKQDRLKVYHPLLLDDGSIILQTYFSPLFKINSDSELEWVKEDVKYHHSAEEDIDGNIWICVGYYPYKIEGRYTGYNVNSFRDDGIRKLSPEGDILFDKSLSELFIENKMEYLLFGMNRWHKDPIHLNDIQPVYQDGKYWRKGDVFLSLRNQSMIILYRPSTNKIIWKGTGQFSNQHDVDILDETKISIFDNNYKYTGNRRRGLVDGNNRVIIYDFEKDEYTLYNEKSLIREKVKSTRGGSSEILDNGDFLVEETHGGRLLYFNKDGSLRWSYLNRADDGNIYNLGWSRILNSDRKISLINNFLGSRSLIK